MAIKVIAQLREVKLGKNPGKKFVMRPDLCDQGSLGCCRRSDSHLGDRGPLHPHPRTRHDALRRPQ